MMIGSLWILFASVVDPQVNLSPIHPKLVQKKHIQRNMSAVLVVLKCATCVIHVYQTSNAPSMTQMDTK